MSADRCHALSVIVFIGSVFSPYYAWSGRRDPYDHVAYNVALYGRTGARWTMTERRRSTLLQRRDHIAVGPSRLAFDGDALIFDIREIATPIPKPTRGQIRVVPQTFTSEIFSLDSSGRHIWRPVAPIAHVEATFDAPALSWQGEGYFDCNFGTEPLEAGFVGWDWSRAATPAGATILYDAVTREGKPCQQALHVRPDGRVEVFDPPMRTVLPRSGWRIPRTAHADPGASARVVRTLLDTPFYVRSLIESTVAGHREISFHESLSLDRFRHPLVQTMLPFRMPRRFF